MAIWTKTFAKMTDSIVYLFTRTAGKEQANFQERQLVQDAVNEAMVQVLMSRGVDRWNFNTQPYTATITSGSREVALPEGTISVVSGSVRIASEKQTLYPTSMEAILESDPNNESTGIPIFYAFDSTTTPDTPKLIVAPVPNADFTIAFTAETLVDKDSTLDFPSFLHGPICDLATAIAMRRLGFGNPLLYEAAYENSEANVQARFGNDTPMHINRSNPVRVNRGIQHRLPS